MSKNSYQQIRKKYAILFTIKSVKPKKMLYVLMPSKVYGICLSCKT